MKVHSINNKLTYTNNPTPKQPFFRGNLRISGDKFVRSDWSPSALNFINDIKTLLKIEGVDSKLVDKFLKIVTPTNYKSFCNLSITMLNLDRLKNMFCQSNTDNYCAHALLNHIREDNKNFANAYTALGGRNFGIVKDASKLHDEVVPKLDLKNYNIDIIEEIIESLTPENANIIEQVINRFHFSTNEITSFLNEIKYWYNQEMLNISENIENGFGDYLTEVVSTPNHKLKRTINTQDFKQMSPEFIVRFNEITINRGKLFNILRFPLESPKKIETVFRKMGSVMSIVDKNASKTFDEYDTRRTNNLFFATHFNDVLGLLFYTDKETTLHILDKGVENAGEHIKAQKRLNLNEAALLQKVIKTGKKLNTHGDLADISAKDKFHAYNLFNINRNYLASTVGEIDFQSAITPIKEGVTIDFKSIEADMQNKIFKYWGFSESEIKALNPKDMDWDCSLMHLLLDKKHNPNLTRMIIEASKGNFEKFIFDETTPIGQANKFTKEIFKARKLDYETWLKGIPPKEFYIGNEKLTISLWTRRPQDSIFNGTYTTCCTALNGTQRKSMQEYLQNTAINVFEIKNARNEVVATSRVFLLNEHDPIMMVDNIEINNTFKKKLFSVIKRETLMENIFDYEREFIKQVAQKNIRIYFSKENVKLLDSEAINYPKEMLYTFELIGKIAEPKTYCNYVTGGFEDIDRAITCVYNISKKPS